MTISSQSNEKVHDNENKKEPITTSKKPTKTSSLIDQKVHKIKNRKHPTSASLYAGQNIDEVKKTTRPKDTQFLSRLGCKVRPTLKCQDAIYSQVLKSSSCKDLKTKLS